MGFQLFRVYEEDVPQSETMPRHRKNQDRQYEVSVPVTRLLLGIIRSDRRFSPSLTPNFKSS